ncbi:MerR family transcriptional regulator [Streptomyces sp. HNM0574]|uniref:MerR family transcriptional regulator n=1 Tax=Streptomyces sp. HNM0574 TaxID=2714954 RepID=UPI00146E9D3F|nr:MerR family transcriptional regulator [Streptomyces sp. HNM0574]NLU69796.1 MerR family transcriptional regulator [Streptomyces sp. HNM0574]
MRLAELSEHSGLPTATIKYYLREGLLPPGRRVSATQSEYDENHLRRLRLVRALIQVGGLPVSTAREVLAAVDDGSRDLDSRLGAAVNALPHGKESTDPGNDVSAAAAAETARELVSRLGWDLAPASPAYRMLLRAVAGLHRLGYPCDLGSLMPYARAAADIAVSDLDLVESLETTDARIEAAVACTVLYEPVLLSLRRLAEAEESNRRFGGGSRSGQE